ncbi:MAG: ABC transporter ATP-binding protein [Candidatus Moraniibacteriota bacterium]
MFTLKFIIRNLDQFFPRFIVVFIVGAVDSILVFMIPVLLAEFTKGNFNQQVFQRLFLYILSLYAGSLILDWILRKYGESLAVQFGNHIKIKYFRALQKLPFKNILNTHSGYLLSLINKVSDGLEKNTYSLIWHFSQVFIVIALFVFFTARESIPIAFINLIILSVFVLISTKLANKMVPIDKELNLKRALFMGYYADFIANLITIKKLSIGLFAEKKLKKRVAENYNQIYKLQKFHANRWLLLHLLFGIAFFSTIGFVLYSVAQGTVSPAILILFVGAYQMVRSNIERLSENIRSLMETRAYLDNLESIVSLSREYDRETFDQPVSWNKIAFRHVVFLHKDGKRKIKIPDFCIKKGEKICIVGKSGEGKTTFLNLLANLFAPEGGRRLVDSNLYEKISPVFFSQQFGIVSQEIELFNISVKDNITIGKNVKERKIMHILEELDLSGWVKGLPRGLDTMVGEKGVKLSAGQKQRLNLARGYFLGREICLLDEPTSHLDVATESKVIKFLEKYFFSKTLVIVTHRSKIKKICNREYSMEKGVLKETKEEQQKQRTQLA